MYEAKNPAHLMLLLKTGKLPITVKDHDTIMFVEALESLKQKGVVATVKDALNPKSVAYQAVAESTVVILGIVTILGLLTAYAIYKGLDVKIKYNSDGSIEIEYKHRRE